MYIRGIVAGAVAALLAGLTCAGAQSPVVQGRSGAWTEVFAAGMTAYQTGNGNSALEIGCDVGMTLDHSMTGIALTLNGRMLPPNSEVSFIVDGKAVSIPSAKSGGISLNGCPECTARFQELWPLLRTGRAVEVVASDGNRAQFSLNGSAALLPATPCPGP